MEGDQSKGTPPAPQAPRLLEQVRDAIRRKHYSYRTEQAYIHWIKRFIYFPGERGVASALDRIAQATNSHAGK